MGGLIRKQLREAEKASSNWVSMLRSGAIWQGGSVQISIQQADEFPSLSRNGWQQKTSDVVENVFLARPVWPTLAQPEQALLRSQQGPMAGLPFTNLPLCAETIFQSQEFKVLFLRRLWQPLPLSSFTCRCGRPLDSRGHHRAACPLGGVLGRRGFALESAAARVCLEAGGRVTTNVLVQGRTSSPWPSAEHIWEMDGIQRSQCFSDCWRNPDVWDPLIDLIHRECNLRWSCHNCLDV